MTARCKGPSAGAAASAGLAVLLAACNAGPHAAPSAAVAASGSATPTAVAATSSSGASPAAVASSAAASQPVHITGLLTLKGPELGAWWAVADDAGTVWRVEPASPEQAAQWRAWQNQRVSVDGTPLSPWLQTPRVRALRLRPAP